MFHRGRIPAPEPPTCHARWSGHPGNTGAPRSAPTSMTGSLPSRLRRSPGMTGGGFGALRPLDTLRRCRARMPSRALRASSLPRLKAGVAPRHEEREARGWRALKERLRASGQSRKQIGRSIQRPPRWFSAFRSTPGAHGASPLAGRNTHARPATPAVVSRRRHSRHTTVLRGPCLVPASPGTASAKHPPRVSRDGIRRRTTLTHPLPRHLLDVRHRLSPAGGYRASRRRLARRTARTPHPAPPTGRHR